MAILPQNQKRVIVNADDFGLASPINEGIIAAHKAGIIKSASLLANGEGFEDAVQKLKQHPKLSAGIHLTLVWGKPVSKPEKVPSLIFKNRQFAPGYKAFAIKYYLQKVNLKEVEYEWERQREKLDDIQIDHIDSHQHLHLLPGLFKIVVKLSLKWKVNYIRLPFENINVNIGDKTVIPKLILNLYCLGKKTIIDGNCLKTSDYFYGSSHSGSMTEPIWRRLWDAIPTGLSEVMCHPGFDDPDMRAKYGWTNRWEDELRALTNPEIYKLAKSKDIKFTNYSEITSDG